MIDVILLAGRLLFVALLYLFLFALMKTGIGLVKGQRKKEKSWGISVERGPIIVGRAPGADIVIGASYVSARHARFSIMGANLFVEDLGSTNGTAVNGRRITEPTVLKNNDVVNVGDVAIRVRYE